MFYWISHEFVLVKNILNTFISLKRCIIDLIKKFNKMNILSKDYNT